MNETLRTDLEATVPGSIVDELGPGALRVLVPNPRWLHDFLAVSIEEIDGGWVLSDTGELRNLAGDDLPELARLLECAGAELDVTQDGVVTAFVDGDDAVSARVLTFTHHLIAAPVLWHARHCMAEAAPPETRPESAPLRLARETRSRLVGRLGKQSAGVLHLGRRMWSRGESARAPLAVAPPAPYSLPLLVATFIDTEASQQAVASAKRQAEWVLAVVQDLSIPKYLVIRGDEAEVSHLADFYDHYQVNAVNFHDEGGLERDAREAIESLGFATSR